MTRASTPRGRDDALVAAIASGDEAAFAAIADAWSPVMLRMAMLHVGNPAVAEEVVQEAWLTVFRDLGRYERRSALRTWVVGIVVNVARARARAERRSIPFDDLEPVFGADRFRSDEDRWPDHWATGPTPWPTPEQALLAGETRQVVLGAISRLPVAQREVLVLRDVEGFSAEQTCNALGLSDTNQRVLLHRARTRVRKAIEDHFEAREPT